MIKLENIEHTRVMYIKKKDILHMEEEGIDGEFDVEITFKDYVSTETLTIEDIKLEDITSKLDSGRWEPLIREFFF